ncbi:hypothetical protein [Streptomyces sp. A30]
MHNPIEAPAVGEERGRYYSNLRWGRTMDARSRSLLVETNQQAFID